MGLHGLRYLLLDQFEMIDVILWICYNRLFPILMSCRGIPRPLFSVWYYTISVLLLVLAYGCYQADRERETCKDFMKIRNLKYVISTNSIYGIVQSNLFKEDWFKPGLDELGIKDSN